MSGMWGRNIKLSIFGESHGKAIGINIDGLPPGFEISLEDVKREMIRRAPGKNNLSTARNESDEFEILSGFYNGKTTGTPLCTIIKNNDKKSEDYSEIERLLRPGHADYTGYIKYNGFNDFRGGGHFSGRITAPIVFAGAISRQILEKYNIVIGSHIKSIENVCENNFDLVNIDETILKKLRAMDFPTLDRDAENKMKEAIINARNEGDSVGGIIECAAVNLPEGLGEPFFDSVESLLSHMLFSIPSVKGVEFGTGFAISTMKGSKANDELYVKNGKVRTYTNNNGGIVGGITNAMPLIFRVAIKPTPSIAKPQRTVNIKDMQDSVISVKGRHDPCIVQRAVPVIEAAASIVLLDLMLDRRR